MSGLTVWFKRLALGTPAVAFGLVLVLSLVGHVVRANLQAAHPAPGTLVDIGGNRLHLYCTGGAAGAGVRPTVVLEAGLGQFSDSWALVQPALATTTRVCSYDRAGLGWSEPSADGRTSRAIVRDLRALLARGGVGGPYVLVGQSLGGLHVSLFAYTYPKDVAGMVLVDSSHEDQDARLPAAFRQSPAQQTQSELLQRMRPVLSGLLRSDLVGLLLLPAGDEFSPRVPATWRREHQLLVVANSHALATVFDEGSAIEESNAQVRAAREALGPAPLHNRPLQVLTRGAPMEVDLPRGITPEVARAYDAAWLELQHELATLSSRGTQVVVPRSGHMIQLEDPAAVVTAVEEVVVASGRSSE